MRRPKRAAPRATAPKTMPTGRWPDEIMDTAIAPKTSATGKAANTDSEVKRCSAGSFRSGEAKPALGSGLRIAIKRSPVGGDSSGDHACINGGSHPNQRHHNGGQG